MSHDPGAARIVRLMTRRDPAFVRAARQLAAALPDGFGVHAAPPRQLMVDPALIAAVQRVQGQYRALRARIEAIETARAGGKARAVSALDELDTSFSLLVRSTDATSYSAYEELVREAALRQARAAGELRTALEELA